MMSPDKLSRQTPAQDLAIDPARAAGQRPSPAMLAIYQDGVIRHCRLRSKS
jgi:hypothetical protein